MAFIGVALIKQVADGLVRITGLSLATGTSGTIGLFEKLVAPDVRLPEGFKARSFSRPGQADVKLQDCVEVSVQLAGAPASLCTLGVAKTGTEPTDFQAEVFALTQDINEEQIPTGPLEIYVRYH